MNPPLVVDPGVAFIGVDLQRATTQMAAVNDMDVVIANAARLANAFRARSRPVVLTVGDLNHPPPGRTEFERPTSAIPAAALGLVPPLTPQRGDIVLSKRGWSAFSADGLHHTLREASTTQVVLAGLATSYGIESSARQAYDLGYNVVIVTDAINNPQRESHDNSLTWVLPALGQLATTDELLALLQRD